MVSWYEKVVMAPNVQGRGGDTGPCPVDEAEAYQTHQCISALAPYLRDTVVMEWTRAGTCEMKAKWLGVGKSAYFERLSVAETKLLDYMRAVEIGEELPKAIADPARAKKRHDKKVFTLPDNNRTFAGTMA